MVLDYRFQRSVVIGAGPIIYAPGLIWHSSIIDASNFVVALVLQQPTEAEYRLAINCCQFNVIKHFSNAFTGSVLCVLSDSEPD